MSKIIAASKIDKEDFDTSSPISIVEGVSWEFEEKFLVEDDRLLLERNLCLTSDSPLGKIALAIAAIEKYFPNCKIEIGEVWKDDICNELVKKIEASDEMDTNEIEKLLLFDELRLVIYVDEEPFDYLANHFGLSINHLKVKKFPVWDYLDLLRELNLIMHGFYHDCNEYAFLAQMKKIVELFPESCFAIKTLRNAHFQKQGADLEYVELIRQESRRKMSIFNLYGLYFTTKDDFWMQLLVSEYGHKVIEYLQGIEDEQGIRVEELVAWMEK
ncbi:hypothetical protein ACFL08_05515 [Patescibacteria group bacterium]